MNFDNFLHLSNGLSTEELENYRNRVRKLLIKGQAEGELSQGDIEEAIPHSIVDVEALNELFEAFESAGIKIIRDKEALVESLQIKLTIDGYKWIRRSALTERAYWIGAHEALTITDSNDDQLKSVFSQVLGTIYHRRGDNSFPNTHLGKLFDELDKFIQVKHMPPSTLQEIAEKLHRQLDLLNMEFGAAQTEVNGLICGLQKLIQNKHLSSRLDTESRSEYEQRLFEILQAIKPPLQYLALLETSHDIQSRFD